MLMLSRSWNSALTACRRWMSPDTSTSIVVHACGIKVALLTMFSAIRRRMGVSGIRSSSAPGTAGAGAVWVAAGAGSGVATPWSIAC